MRCAAIGRGVATGQARGAGMDQIRTPRPHREFRRPWAGDLSQWAIPGGRRCVEMRRGI